MRRTILALAVSGAFGAAMANPTGPATVSGATLISNPSASVLQIVNTPGTIMHWNTFSIAGGETTRFVQQNAASAILNRVVGASPSDILGRLESNGRVFLVNPNGIVFGGGAVVDVAGLIASTRDISNANFLAGNYLFNGPGSGTITVQSGAQILTSTYGPGGQVWLFAKNVTQEAGSTITAPQGQVVLAAGSQLQVATNGLGNMTFAVTTDGTNTIDSLGTIAADQGAVGMFADFVNHRGTINAANGTVFLHGGAQVDLTEQAVINADGANGRITFRSNDLRVASSGNVHAVNGEVIFDQYAPSQWTAGAPIPFGFRFNDVLTTPAGNGTFLVRGVQVNAGVLEGVEMLLDADGNLLSGPTVIVSPASFPSVINSFAAGLGFYWFGSEIQDSPRLFLGTGGWVQKQTGTVNLFGSNGALLRALPLRGSTVPLWDGTVAQPNDRPSDPVRFFKADGTEIASRNTALDESKDAASYATRDGMILMGLIDGTNDLGKERWTKTVPAYTAGTSLAGDAGPAANFATTPGVAQGAAIVAVPAPPAPPAPPVITGSGAGASFGGVSGCNSSVCSDEVLAARALIDAQRAAAAVDQLILIDAQRATEAVRALQAAEQARRADPNAGPVVAGLVIRDFGEMARLTQQIAEFYETATPDQIRDTAAAARKVMEAFLQREALSQQRGADPASPNEMRQVDLILNMDDAQRRQYFEMVVTDMQRGQVP